MAKVGRLIKELAVKELTTSLKERPHFFVASWGTLTSVETDAFRKRLRASQARLVTVKRTLGLKSLAELKLDEAIPLFDGSVALVLPGKDLIQAAKLLVELAKGTDDNIAIRGGWVEGQLLNKQRLEELASLPSKPQLIAGLVAVLESPMTSLIMTVEGALRELVRVVEAMGAQAAAAKPAAESAPAAAADTPAPSAPTPMAAPDQTNQQEGTAHG